MKNKYLEVEALPAVTTEIQGEFFKLKPIQKKLNYQKASKKINKKIYRLPLRAAVLLFMLFYPLLSSGQIGIKEEIIEKTNYQRNINNLGELKINPLLEKAALAKAEDMFRENYFSHTSPQGKNAWDYLESYGYDYVAAGENLAIDYLGADEVLAAWMNSKTHRQNILDQDFYDIGLAVVTGQLNEKNATLIVQIFGTEK